MQNTPKNENSVYVISDLNKVSDNIKDKYFKIMAIPEPKKSTKNSITFEGEEYLTFAFSCIQLNVNDSGNIEQQNL